MKARTNINVHLSDDTVCRTSEGTNYVCVIIDESLYLYFDSENQIHELMGALEAASSHLWELVNKA